MIKKQKLRLTVAIISLCLALAGILSAVLGNIIPTGFRFGLLIAGIAFTVVSIGGFTSFVCVHLQINRIKIKMIIEGARKNRERQLEEDGKKNAEDLKQNKNEIYMYMHDRIAVNIFGKTKILKIFVKRSKDEVYEPDIYDFDKLPEDIPYKVSYVLLNEKELDALKWLVKTLPHNEDKVKADVLDYVNTNYDRWNDDWKKAHSFAILPYETEINTVCLDFSQNVEVVALCGDCRCDENRGISISFRNRKFAGVSKETDFAKTDFYDVNGQLKYIYKEFLGK